MGRKNKNKRMKKKSVGNGVVKPAVDATTSIPRSIEHTPEPIHDTIVVAPPPPASQTRLVLAEGRKDLKNAQPPLGFLFDPLRATLLDPTMALASIVVPGVVSAVPMVDGIAATFLKIPFQVAKFGYGLVPFRGNVDLALVAQNDILCTTSAGSSPLPPFLAPESIQNLIQLSIAFGLSSIVDVAGAVLNPSKASTWLVSLWQFLRYLDSSQLDKNLSEAIVKPFWSGRAIDNINIYRRLQESNEHRHARAHRFRRSQIQNGINEGAHMIKFATAAYGTGMISSALDDRNVNATELSQTKTAIAAHVGIKKDDIKYMCVSEGGNMKLLRHFVAVDRKNHNVVLAVRGTLSVSGALIDMQAEDADFLSGKAHRGMSEMAVNLWNATGEKIRDIFASLEQNGGPQWGFVITGHSLGAGTAALLNLKCHVENLVGNRPVKCFCFASPPVFVLEESHDSVTAHAIDKAIKSCTCYIQGDDCVPFLSIVQVSKLAAQLETVDDATKDMWPLDRMALALGKMEIPQELVDAVHHVEQPVVPGASRLTVPAEKVVWAFEKEGGFDVIGCLPDELANLSIFLSANMITDHFPKKYEDSLDALAK